MSRPATDKYQRVRGALLFKGLSLRAWARGRGYNPSTVYMAARGERSGVKAARIMRDLEEFCSE